MRSRTGPGHADAGSAAGRPRDTMRARRAALEMLRRRRHEGVCAQRGLQGVMPGMRDSGEGGALGCARIPVLVRLRGHLLLVRALDEQGCLPEPKGARRPVARPARHAVGRGRPSAGEHATGPETPLAGGGQAKRVLLLSRKAPRANARGVTNLSSFSATGHVHFR